MQMTLEVQKRPSWALSIAIFVVATALMFYLRLHVFGDRYITLTYGLPLLVCLWHRDVRLLWAMGAAFLAMATYKAFVLLPSFTTGGEPDVTPWVMQVINTILVASVVHIVIRLTGQLQLKNAQLEEANAELAASAEEITRQNEELQAQSEELAQQNEEIQAQSEELTQQNEELQQQAQDLQLQTQELEFRTDELQVLNTELNQRESMLQTLLESLRLTGGDRPVLERICQAMLDLLPGTAVGAAIVEKIGQEVVVRAHAGMAELTRDRWPFATSFAAVVMQQEKTASVANLAARPDLVLAQASGQAFRSVLAAPFRLNGKPAGVVEVFADEPREWTTEDFRVLEWVAAQATLIMEVRRLQDELGRTNTRLEELVQDRTAKLQELVGELEHFSYSITHDMRSPLRAMQGFAEMLEEECGTCLNAERQEYLRRIRSAANRMDRLITDSLSYSKVLREELRLAPVDTAKLLQEILESYPEFQPPRAEIEVQEPLPVVLANEAGLAQCFSNLLGNAVKFVPPNTKPSVKVRAEQNGSRVRLWVEDRGIGIPTEMKSRIFDMFQRASKAYDGTGIGLALVRKVCERMGGKVGVESEPGQGSRFWLDLRAPNLNSGKPRSGAIDGALR